ncbi:Crp/Fnr family transcriptional regulator [Campylobacter sp.]|uniref:Crp/Fnr family transcriptional regulator n=1 Tax=Campylobacter sp. TaxID=205 RepID=UPI00270BC777|nr:Crp/Fnr family transcriptional regulator [Campylobacter sp.]
MKRSRLGLLQTETIDILNEEELSKFNHEFLEKNSIIYSDFIKIIILKSGSAKVSIYEDGEEFIIYNLQQNNITILDEACAIETLEDSEIYSLDVKDIDEILSNFEFSKAYTQTLVNIIILQRQIIQSILFENAKGRIASFLIELAKEQNLKQGEYYYVFLPFSLKVLSSFVGLKRQSASTAFNELIKEGVLTRTSPHECLILDYEKLQSYTT